MRQRSPPAYWGTSLAQSIWAGVKIRYFYLLKMTDQEKCAMCSHMHKKGEKCQQCECKG